jgi:hypothetical protein
MTISKPTERLALTGADCFLRAFDAETHRLSRASHLSQLVLRLGEGFDPAGLRKTLTDLVRANPILRAPIRRRFGVAPPSFDLRTRVRGREIPIEQHAPQPGTGRDPVTGWPPIPEVFYARLSGKHRIERGELMRFDFVEYEDGPIRVDLAMTWSHMLLDGSGSELFVDALAEAFETGQAAPLDETRPDPIPALREPFAARSQVSRDWLDHMNGFGKVPPVSLAGPARRTPQALRYDLHAFDVEASARVRARAAESAGFMTPVAFYLAAAIRAHAAVYRRRGLDPQSFVVPLPVNMRAKRGKGGKGGSGPVFQTQVAMMWFQAMPDEVEDFQTLVDSLKAQRLAAIQGGLIERAAVAIDFIRFMPARAYAKLARSTFRGELASFLFAFTDAFLPGRERFFGAPIVDGFHAPSVTPSPGSSLIMSTRDTRLNVAHVHQAGLYDDAERACLAEQLREDFGAHSAEQP